MDDNEQQGDLNQEVMVDVYYPQGHLYNMHKVEVK
jgi:hypothetical protein